MRAEAAPGSPLRRATPAFAAPVLVIAATYVAFLLWAQFGFVTLLRERLGAGPEGVRMAMAAMGIAGFAASFGTGALLRRVAAVRLVRAGLAAVALISVAALGCRTPAAFAAVAAATGAAMALLTVALAAGLRSLLPDRRGGLVVGSATGLAYLACNLPPVFEAPPRGQALLVAMACWLALLALARVKPGAPERSRRAVAPAGEGLAVAAGVAAFLALVWIDSAAFAAIQQRPDLAAATWGTASGKLAIGAAHLLAAVAAGALLDAGRLLPLLAGSAGIFALALPAIESGAGSHPTWGRLWGLLYACGISAYSTALVTWPGRIGRKVGKGGEPPAGMPPRWRAALLYGVAGWLGSALGVGMAEDLRRIPTAAVAAAVAVVWIACALLRRGRHLRSLWGPTLGLTLLFGGAVLGAGQTTWQKRNSIDPNRTSTLAPSATSTTARPL
jgi:cytochrome c oxidase cbb3-type subunit 2